VRPLRILHVLRAPVGGLFRHVLDLARLQAERGHQVGIVADSAGGGSTAEAQFKELAPLLRLAITRVPMSRHIGPRDISAIRHVSERARKDGADVLHGHGAKGGAYARLAAGTALRVYTPHGGSLHYSPGSPLGLLYLTAERLLARRTDLFLFESAYGAAVFRDKVGEPRAPVRVVHNGVLEADFVPVVPAADAADIVFIGELRDIKGIDVLIDALGALARGGRVVTANIVGDGPDAAALRERAVKQGIAGATHFVGALPAREGFRRGRLLVIPSKIESLPYIVLEAGAAGMPMLTTKVGGIPEILGSEAARLLPAGDPEALASAIAAALDRPQALAAATQQLRERIGGAFSATAMTDGALAAYREAMRQRPVNG
jgi:glycosyltransferase involved in cell wall biosynthesis